MTGRERWIRWNNTEWTFDKGTTSEGNQREVLDYLNERVALVVDGYREGKGSVTDNSTITGDDFRMEVIMERMYGEDARHMLRCAIDIHVTRHECDGRTEESGIDHDGRFPFEHK